MAQAARLNLRMQKELKLLLKDPPHGASFPSLSDEATTPSLTSIDALFRGPAGTVYANGVFKINIQIPERYPFQPPIVTFSTPIYHPNIDNGGRICLDILNLPPKGTWQPSLNISTVLTSIGLLLSEPNPDDGLMHEASREYKYNRQAFDQNARSMTEKYATAGETEIASGSHGSQTLIGPSTAQTEMDQSDASIRSAEHFVHQTRYSASSTKLSLESLGSSSNLTCGSTSKVQMNVCSKNHIDIGQLKTANNISTEHKVNPGKLQASRNKLSLKGVVPHTINGGNTNVDLPNHCSSKLDPISKEKQPLRCVKLGQSGNSDKQNLPKEAIARKGSGSSISRLKKVGLVETVPSSGQLEGEKENLVPISTVFSENGKCYDGRTEKQAVNSGLRLSEMTANPPLKPVEQLPSSTNEESLIPEAVIVLDSEDSEDENIPVRSKLSLAKRCISRKRKSVFVR